VDLVAEARADAILLTHFHVDHVQGLFPLRWGKGERIPLHVPDDPGGCADLLVHPGLLDVQTVRPFEPIVVGCFTVTPVPLTHSKPTVGYCLTDGETRVAYLVDTRGLPDETIDFLESWRPEEVALDCSYPAGASPGRGHNDVGDVRELLALTSTPARYWLTHVGHELDCAILGGTAHLPPAARVPRDGE
jgi:phosphoribosyl 1,2-cyclic phosphate phosphodiesterase